jgi:importin subunit alpha-1
MSTNKFIPEHRRTNYKAQGVFKPDELRRRREEQQVEIRRNKREENLAKRRGISAKDGNVIAGQGGPGSVDSDDDGTVIEGTVSFTFLYLSFANSS